MKSIQCILTIIMAVFLIGMMPDLADAKIETITISPDKFVPVTGADNYVRYPDWVTSRDDNAALYWAKIKFPNNVNRLEQVIYYHRGTGGGMSLTIYRSKVGRVYSDGVIIIFSDDDSNEIIKVKRDIPDHPKVDDSWTYWILVSCSNSDVYFHGVKIKVSTE
jgi:hypothetical protein